jgi:hypothetical protein
MTTRSVRSTIQEAMKTRSPCDSALVTTREAGKIVKEAEQGYVSVGEGKEVGDLFDRSVPQGSASMTRMCPENGADAPLLADGGAKKFEAFFVRHDLPYGRNAAPLREQLREHSQFVDFGAPLAAAPSTTNRFPIVLRDDRPVDGAKQTAWYDPKDKSYYVQSEAWSRLNGGEIKSFYGPFTLEQMMHTMMIPENPGDGMSATLAIPENPGDDVSVFAAPPAE